MSEEDDRAAAWRAQRERRVAFELGLRAKLAGNPDAAVALHDNFAAWLPVDEFGVVRYGVNWWCW